MRVEELGLTPLARIGSTAVTGLSLEKLNVNGGAIAVGHPFGMAGARIATTLINSLQWHDKRFGVESMCVGGGMGMVVVVERLK
jgi:acetyl-CoA C-acetyltransferase